MSPEYEEAPLVFGLFVDSQVSSRAVEDSSL